MFANFELHYQLGNVLLNSSQADDAVIQLQETIRLKPDYAEGNTNLAIALKLQAASGH